jgi:DNA-binding LytR/AlgR family response regulator
VSARKPSTLQTLDELRALERGRPGLMKELIRLFVADAPKQMRLIDGAYGKRDPEAVRETIGPLERSLLTAHGRGCTRRLIAERANAYRVIECTRIILLESRGNYIEVTELDETETACLRGTLQSVAAVLDPDAFLRINRSTIVNLACVAGIERDDDGRLVFRMGGIERAFKVGRSFNARVVQRMKL